MQSQTQAVQAALDKAPDGWAWPRRPRSVLGRTLTPLAHEGVLFEQAAEAQLREGTPSRTDKLLGDYERVLGPDTCLAPATGTVEARRRAVHSRWVNRAGAARKDYVSLAAALGWSVTITEFVPAAAGTLAAGGLLYGPAWAFAWLVTATPAEAASDGEAPDAAALECVLRRQAPAHTVVIILLANVSGIGVLGPLDGPDGIGLLDNIGMMN